MIALQCCVRLSSSVCRYFADRAPEWRYHMGSPIPAQGSATCARPPVPRNQSQTAPTTTARPAKTDSQYLPRAGTVRRGHRPVGRRT